MILLNEPFPVDGSGAVDEGLLQEALDRVHGLQHQGATELRVTEAFAEVLSCNAKEIDPSVDFFSLGGDSLRAGRLISCIRQMFGVQLPIYTIFDNGSIQEISKKVDSMLESNGKEYEQEPVTPICQVTHSSSNPFLMILQLVPLAMIYPIRRGSQWTLFLLTLTYTQRWSTSNTVYGRLINLIVSIMFARICTKIVAPVVGILFKWMVIGRYKEGIYPMWGVYHTRWWMVQKVVAICGKGLFGLNNTTKNIYCRLMGAKIGKNVEFKDCNLGEWDLLDIRDGARGHKCICRPFAVEGNTSMYLGRITVGKNSSIGIGSIVAPGAVIPPDTHIGHNSSSWEMGEGFDEVGGDRPIQPSLLLTLLVTYPLLVLGLCLQMLPWIGGLVGMVIERPNGTSSLRQIIQWFSEPRRMGFHFLALVLNVLFSPVVGFLFAVTIKRLLDLVFGRIPFSRNQKQSSFNLWRSSLIKTLLPGSKLHDFTGMFGQHYQVTSIALRMLGARIGKRVYWPGTGPSMDDYHQLDIGDDVVFGSRSHLVTSDKRGSSGIAVGNGSMIADRVVLQPGVTIGDRTVMGTGALTQWGATYTSGATYVGSKNGDAIYLGSEQKRNEKQVTSSSSSVTDGWAKDKSPHVQIEELNPSENSSESGQGPKDQTLSPFGRAFYLKQAPYYVFNSFLIFVYSTLTIVTTAVFWNLPSITAIQVVRHSYVQLTHPASSYDIAVVWITITFCIAVLTTAQAVIALGFVIIAKWALIGRRVPGNYDWDKSSYCQRWQLHLVIEKIRRHCYHSQGVLGFLTGTEWIVWYFRLLGAKIGQNCALFANGSPAVMFTEPDLITIGSRVAIDDASVVAHINTRGKFDLNNLSIEDGCVLRTGSRLLSGASMKARSCLLEHTLIMGGDTVEEGWTMQGWPAERFQDKRTA